MADNIKMLSISINFDKDEEDSLHFPCHFGMNLVLEHGNPTCMILLHIGNITSNDRFA